jgi:outer membrane protein
MFTLHTLNRLKYAHEINFYNKLLIVILSCTYLSAENILEIYNEALENDPTYKSAEYSYLADKEIVVQGRAALLPSITLKWDN